MNRDLQMKALAASTLLALASGGAAAANRIDIGKLNVQSLNRNYAASVATLGAPTMNHSRHERLLGVEAESFLVMQSSNRSNGAVNRRYVQTYRGLPIYNENLVVSEDTQGNVKALFGNMIGGLASDIASTRPRQSQSAAFEHAKKAALGSMLTAARVDTPRIELVIYVAQDGRASLAYSVKFNAEVAGQPVSPALVIDANNGRVLHQYDNLQTAEIGTGPGGNTKTGQYEYGTNFGYIDVTQSGTTCTMDTTNVKTVDLAHASYTSTKTTPFSYTCPRNTHKAINGAYSPANDAQFFGGVVFKLYADYMGTTTPLNGNKLTLRVHAGNSWENANWDGNNFRMNFGDGGSTFHPLVSLDVMAHEVSHGYTQFQSGLVYSGMSGGMNEAYSGIAGEAAEFFMRGTNDFNTGADIFKGTGALRYMCNPTQDGRSIDHASNFTSSMDVHFSSGVYNKAFCTLAKKAGWDTKAAFQAFARANRDYWTANSTFDAGAVGVLKAACDMGKSGQDVKDAFNVVGVNAGAVPANCGGGGGNTAPVANFTSSVNGLVVNFTDSSTDSDGTIASRSWNFGDGTTSTATSPSKTYSAAGTYTVTLTVTDNGGATNTKTASVTVTDGGGGGGSVLSNGVPVTGVSGAVGSLQYWTLDVPAGATGLKFVSSGGSGDADMFVKFGAQPTTTSYDCKSEGSTNAETCNIATAQTGTYHVLIKGYSAFSGLSLTGSYTAGGGGGAQTYSNATDYAIADNATVDSPITVSGRTGNAPSTASVTVAIVHTYIGDLKVDLVSPDGSLYNIHNRTGSSTDNINKTVTLNLSTEALNGTWKLRVNDNANADTGYINSWSVTF